MNSKMGVGTKAFSTEAGLLRVAFQSELDHSPPPFSTAPTQDCILCRTRTLQFNLAHLSSFGQM